MANIEFSKLISNNIQKMQEDLDKLLHAKQFKVLDIKSNPKQHDVKGVYLISFENKVVYVGKTRTGTIGTRIRDHCTMSEGSDLKQMIKNHSDYQQDISEYEVQYIEVPNDRIRGLVENFVISTVNPPFNKVEN